MKRVIIILAALALAAALFLAGRASGIRHAVTDCEIWTVSVYDPADPDASAWRGYDLQLFIDLDGQTYEHGAYVG